MVSKFGSKILTVFMHHVVSNIDHVNAMSCFDMQKWLIFVQSMQHVIKLCGKVNAQIDYTKK